VVKRKARDAQCEEYKAALFLRISDGKRFSGLKDQLDDLNLLDKDSYPKTMESALRFLQNYKGAGGKSRGSNTHNYQKHEHDGVAFSQMGNHGGGKGARDISNHTCYNCGNKGHHAKSCPKLSSEERSQLGMEHMNVSENTGTQEYVKGIANMNLRDYASTDEDGSHDESVSTFDSCIEGVGFLEVTGESRDRPICNRNHAYLDSCATNHSMFALEHLNRRHTTGVCLRQNCNAGSRLTKRKGFWMMLQFWENPGGIANLVSLIELERDGWTVNYTTGNIWEVTSPGENVTLSFMIETQGVCKGMPYIDLANPETHQAQACCCKC
jgi:hypothetical protein